MSNDPSELTRAYRSTMVKLEALKDIYGVATNPKIIDLAVDFIMQNRPTLADDRRTFEPQDVTYKENGDGK